MAKKGGPSIQHMHIAFAIASILLGLTTLYAFYQDHFTREFVGIQKEYDLKELERLEKQKAQVGELLSNDALQEEMTRLKGKIDEASQKIDAKSAELDEAQAKIKDIDNRLQYATRQLNFLKADYDTFKYEIDAGRRQLSDLTDQQKKVDEKFAEVKALEAERGTLAESIAAIEKEKKDAESSLTKLEALQSDVELKISKLEGIPAINFLRDAPGIDIVDPRRKINQFIMPNLPVDVFFAKTQRVDRCTTCHTAIANPDPMYANTNSEELDPVFRAHPRLDLFVGENSPHPSKKFGCTVCHQGRPLGVSFVRSAHMPRNDEQKQHWIEKYNWMPMPYWDAKMLPVQHTEASCLKCHKGLDNVPQAAKLNEGRHLFREKGCANCHMGTAGEQQMSWVGRVGPDLRRIGEKTDVNWARNWVENPWEFRPSTNMPRFFFLENREDMNKTGDGHMPRDRVEVEAITTYLFAASKLREQKPAAPPEGNAEAGKTLYALVGCVACHSTNDAPDKFQLNEHGPDLSRVGEKVDAGWLFNWLKSPRHYWPETRMPNLRLTDKEAADLTAYLLKSMRNDKAKLQKLPDAPVADFEQIIRDKLAATTPAERANEMLKDPATMLTNQLKNKVKYASTAGKPKDTGEGEWTEEQIGKIKEILGGMPNPDRAMKAFYAGEVLIQHHGCFSCHNIQGWTYAPLTCPNLKDEGDKDLEKFDFGKALADGSINQTKWDWLYTKIARPRVFDSGKLDLIKPFDRLRMPWFGLTPDKSKEAHPEGGGAHAEGGHGHGNYSADKNPDLATSNQYRLTETQVQRLVTYILSQTNDPVPVEMTRKPTAHELAIDRGHRVVRELNCTGCHLVGLNENPLAHNEPIPSVMPLEALVAVTTPKSQAELKKPGNGIYVDEDVTSLLYENGDAAIPGFIHVLRGTYLTGASVPIALSEKRVRPHALEPFVPIGFAFRKAAKAGWVKYGTLVSPEKFMGMTKLFFANEKDATDSYNRLKEQFVETAAYERLAGTEAVFAAGAITYLDKENRRTARKFFDPATIKLRFTRGEGRVIDHVVAFETKRGIEGASQQLAPPSLSFEGGKVQPDWLYQFLHHVHPLRPGVNIRMPSFWTEGPYSKYKKVYPAGRLSAVNPNSRPTGIGGEPMPSAEAFTVSALPDDAAQLVEFFIADGAEPAYGATPTPILTPDDVKLYKEGQKIVTASDGLGCFNCHSVGRKDQPEPKWAPNLLHVKRRLKEDWVRRFLINPQAIYPWTNMPNNFGLDWSAYESTFSDPHRALLDSDPKKFQETAQKLNATLYFLMRTGEGDHWGHEQAAPQPVITPKK